MNHQHAFSILVVPSYIQHNNNVTRLLSKGILPTFYSVMCHVFSMIHNRRKQPIHNENSSFIPTQYINIKNRSIMDENYDVYIFSDTLYTSGLWITSKYHSGYRLGHWENALYSNASSHWLSTYPKWNMMDQSFHPTELCRIYRPNTNTTYTGSFLFVHLRHLYQGTRRHNMNVKQQQSR